MTASPTPVAPHMERELTLVRVCEAALQAYGSSGFPQTRFQSPVPGLTKPPLRR